MNRKEAIESILHITDIEGVEYGLVNWPPSDEVYVQLTGEEADIIKEFVYSAGRIATLLEEFADEVDWETI